MKRVALCLEAEGGHIEFLLLERDHFFMCVCFHSILSPQLRKILYFKNISNSDKKFYFGNQRVIYLDNKKFYFGIQRVIYLDKIFSLWIEKC